MITIQNLGIVVWLDASKLQLWHLAVRDDRILLRVKAAQEPEENFLFLFGSIALNETQRTWLATLLSNNLVFSLTKDIQVDIPELLKICQQK